MDKKGIALPPELRAHLIETTCSPILLLSAPVADSLQTKLAWLISVSSFFIAAHALFRQRLDVAAPRGGDAAVTQNPLNGHIVHTEVRRAVDPIKTCTAERHEQENCRMDPRHREAQCRSDGLHPV
jgi:hypothetical protein